MRISPIISRKKSTMSQTGFPILNRKEFLEAQLYSWDTLLCCDKYVLQRNSAGVSLTWRNLENGVALKAV